MDKNEHCLTFNGIVKHFNPAWFAAVMGTAVIPLAIAFSKIPLKMPLATFFFSIAILMFLAALVPWTIKLFRYPAEFKKDLNHPVAGNFLPTMPISLIIFSLIFLKFPEMVFSQSVSYNIAFYLWLLGSIGIYVMGFIILIHIFRHKGIDLPHANFGWYIPPVSKLIISVAGFELARVFPQSMELTFGLSIVSLGVGFFLFMFVGAAVYHRYIYHELPINRFAATFFIGVAPTAIIAIVLFKMIQFFEQTSLLSIDPHVFVPVAKILILATWGFSIWWFCMAVIVILYYIRKMDLPYALSWWAFTFPAGALSVASGVAWKVSGFSFVYYIYGLSLIFLLVMWIIVFIRTAKGVASGKIFAPTH